MTKAIGGFPRNLLLTAILLLQTSLCFAEQENSINVILGPDVITHCNVLGIEVAITENSSLGVAPQSCTTRPSVGFANDQVTNKFDRIGVNWLYYFNGAIEGGYFMGFGAGVENVEYRSVAGSTAKVQFIDAAVGVGYQWIWQNGFNVDVAFSIAHLMLNSLDKSISPTESSTVSSFLDRQTSTGTHPGIGFYFGWAF